MERLTHFDGIEITYKGKYQYFLYHLYHIGTALEGERIVYYKDVDNKNLPIFKTFKDKLNFAIKSI